MLLLLSGFLLLDHPSSALGQDSTLIDFELKDQFDQVHTDDQYQGHVTVMIGSDRGGSQYNGVWGDAIFDSLAGVEDYDQIKSLPIADMRGVPFFMKGFVKGKFPKDPEEWVLLDWKGILPQAYDFQTEKSNIMVFDQAGRIRHRVSVQELDEENLQRILFKIRFLMSNNERGWENGN